MAWAGFTDEQLSMIASHLAGGRSFCCPDNLDWVRTVSDTRRQCRRLGDYAHEAWGCRWVVESREHWETRVAHYLENFLNTV